MATIRLSATGVDGSVGDSTVELSANALVPGGLAVPTLGVPSLFGSGELILSATSTAGNLGQLMPAQGSRIQRPGWRLKIAGIDWEDGLGPGEIEAERSFDRSIQTASFSLVGGRGLQLGSPLNTLGAPSSGLSSIDLSVAFLRDDGVRLVEPVMSNGIVDDQEREVGPIPSDRISVLDAMQRFAKKRISYQLAEGSGIGRRTLIDNLFAAAGDTSRALPAIPGTITKPVDLARGDFLSVAQGQAETVGARLARARTGELTAFFDRPELGLGAPTWTFTPSDWIAAINGSPVRFKVGVAQRAATKVTVRASKQVLRGPCGSESSRSRFLHTEYAWVPTVMPYTQGNGTYPPVYAATGIVTPAPKEEVTEEALAISVTRCGEEVSSRVLTEGFLNLEVPRFRNDTDGSIYESIGCAVESNTEDAPGWWYVLPRWMPKEEITVNRFYDTDGFLIRVVTEKWRWHNPLIARKQRPNESSAWDTAVAISTYRTMADGRAVTYDRPKWMLFERITESFKVADGYNMVTEVSTEGWGLKPGTLQLYHDGKTYSSPSQEFITLEAERETWKVKGEGRSSRRVERFGIDGQRIDSDYEPSLGQGPPAAHKAAWAYGDADRFENAQLEASCRIRTLGGLRPESEVEETGEYVESLQEARQMCDRIALTGAAPWIEWQIPINPRIEPGARARLIGRSGEGVNHDLTVRNVKHRGPVRGPFITTIRALYYPELSLLEAA